MSKIYENLGASPCSTAVPMQGLSCNFLHVSFASCSHVSSVGLGFLLGFRNIEKSVGLEAFIQNERLAVCDQQKSVYRIHEHRCQTCSHDRIVYLQLHRRGDVRGGSWVRVISNVFLEL